MIFEYISSTIVQESIGVSSLPLRNKLITPVPFSQTTNRLSTFFFFLKILALVQTHHPKCTNEESRASGTEVESLSSPHTPTHTHTSDS